MSVAWSPREIRNKNKARLWTALWVVLLLILLVLPILTYQDPPPGQEGILVNLGLPDQGQGNENAGPSQPQEEQREEPEEPRETQAPSEPEPEAEVTEKEVVTTEDPTAVALEKAREEQARKEQQAREKAQQEAEARRKAEEAARKKAQAEAEELKDQLGGLFGTGEGKGETSTKGNQGDPGGDPNADKLKGISTGPGDLGGGLGGRGVLSAPDFNDQSQVQGSVTIKVCVDENGSVTSAKFTQSGSSISNGEVIQRAESNASKWKFTPGKKACGTITYKLKLK